MEFSFVIPAYNCQEYLAEAIESVLRQDFGFLEHMQLVIVDDGSTDGTSDVAKAYRDAFPDNIVYIRQDNAGASMARLRGLESAEGTYVNFLDADDKWSADACSEAAAFFKAHPEMGIVAARHQYFGAQEGKHPLWYKFKEDAVIDLRLTVNYPQLSLNNAFIRKNLLKPAYFDGRIAYSEDFLVINRILFDELRYGIMSVPTYWYRKRVGGGSAIDTSNMSLGWYFDTPRLCYKQLFEECRARFGEVLPYLQFTVMYDMQWRIKNKMADPLDDAQREEYRRIIVDLLQDVDDEIVGKQHNLNIAQKALVLGMKHSLDARDVLAGSWFMDGELHWRADSKGAPARVATRGRLSHAHLEFIDRSDGMLRFEGHIEAPLAMHRLSLAASYGGKRWVARLFARADKKADSFFEDGYVQQTGFVLEIPCDCPLGRIDFILSIDGHDVKARLSAGKFCPISFRPFEYAAFGDCMLKERLFNKSSLSLVRTSKAGLLAREAGVQLQVLARRPDMWGTLEYRRFGFVHRFLAKEDQDEIWLVSDRTTLAGDNGEALFRYLCEHPLPHVKAYFVLNEDSPDYERMRAYGPVVAFGSREHKRLQLMADMVISSAADEYVFNRSGIDWNRVKAFCDFRFVFLQHGITKDDMSGWLNRWNKDIRLFITAAKPEYDSILQNPAYGYGADQVALTGFARHDGLLEDAAAQAAQRKVLITPTWRENLTGESDPKTGRRLENPAFEDSDYFAFYQGLLNDERLRRAAEDEGWDFEFLIHPALAQEAHKFTSDFAVIRTEYSYREQFVTSAIMVTDFSSVAFDFALLRKPVLYAQFDYESFYRNHAWEHGYFDYQDNGFGPVCHDLDSTVEALLALMEDSQMPEEYRQRADAFFYEPPTTRCEAIVERILSL